MTDDLKKIIDGDNDYDAVYEAEDEAKKIEALVITQNSDDKSEQL